MLMKGWLREDEVWITLPNKPCGSAVVLAKVEQNLEWVLKKVNDEYQL